MGCRGADARGESCDSHDLAKTVVAISAVMQPVEGNRIAAISAYESQRRCLLLRTCVKCPPYLTIGGAEDLPQTYRPRLLRCNCYDAADSEPVSSRVDI